MSRIYEPASESLLNDVFSVGFGDIGRDFVRSVSQATLCGSGQDGT